MNGKLIIELIGYLGSALVVVSMLMTSVVRLRVINTIGSIIFTCYALIIHSYPTAFMNLCLVAINIYHLMRLLREEKQYDLIMTDGDDHYVSYLLAKNRDDMNLWFPGGVEKVADADLVCLVLCDSNPAGVLLAKTEGDGKADILLDYATPVYRDTTVGRYLYEKLAQQGYRTLSCSSHNPGHTPYLEKMGFVKEEEGRYVLHLG